MSCITVLYKVSVFLRIPTIHICKENAIFILPQTIGVFLFLFNYSITFTA